jgi:hypothetical protein
VIIFGGFGDDAFLGSLYELDLNNFNWHIPKVIGGTPSNRAFHRAVLVGKYMVISFGKYKIVESLFI